MCTYALYPLPKMGICAFALFGIGKMRNSITRFCLDALLQPRRRNHLRSRNLTRGGNWLLMEPSTLCSRVSSQAISRLSTLALKQTEGISSAVIRRQQIRIEKFSRLQQGLCHQDEGVDSMGKCDQSGDSGQKGHGSHRPAVHY